MSNVFTRPGISRALAICAVLALAGCGNDEGVGPDGDDGAGISTAPSAPAGSALLNWPLPLHSIHVADLNEDGLLDLTLTDHLRSAVASHYQEENREFTRQPPLLAVGYHPNSTTNFRAADGQQYLVVNAEGTGALRFYPIQPGRAHRQLGQISSPSPNESVVGVWEGWGPTLVVAGLKGSRVQFFPELDTLPQNLMAAQPKTVPADVANTEVRSLTLADLVGETEPSVVMTMPAEGLVIAMTPQPDRTVRVRPLWRFDLLAAPRVVLPVEIGPNPGPDLFVLSETDPVVSLLLSDGEGRYNLRTFELDGVRGSRAGTVTVDDDGTVLLWAGRQEGLTVLRWDGDADATALDTPVIQNFERPGADTFVLESGDLDGDGHEDLVVGSSLSFVPAAVVYGPLAPKLPEIGEWLKALKAYEESASDSSLPTGGG